MDSPFPWIPSYLVEEGKGIDLAGCRSNWNVVIKCFEGKEGEGSPRIAFTWCHYGYFQDLFILIGSNPLHSGLHAPCHFLSPQNPQHFWDPPVAHSTPWNFAPTTFHPTKSHLHSNHWEGKSKMEFEQWNKYRHSMREHKITSMTSGMGAGIHFLALLKPHSPTSGSLPRILQSPKKHLVN